MQMDFETWERGLRASLSNRNKVSFSQHLCIPWTLFFQLTHVGALRMLKNFNKPVMIKFSQES